MKADPFFQEAIEEDSSSDDEPEVNTSRDVTRKAGARANKNRPTEVSSKRAVTRYREVVDTTQPKIRDPRFESLCGTFNEDTFRKTHGFLYEENLPQEKEVLTKKIKKTKGVERKMELKSQLEQVDRNIKQHKERVQALKVEKSISKQRRDAVKAGSKPFYQKKGDKRKSDLIQKYQELKANGKLDKFLAKRRKKNASKDHKLMPHQRREA
mmetsp:Transcript_19406/g.23202  ORF Transcript_19406/g.23202 Transcript_19406/m.23202 type:complete len:211 (+) Transcript_19406:368-1000(+)|eukprot:CAMPEP_0197859242 /NCGR_PEP_ID=MMETSP1438-20131217/33673_1 /TAXON_ID=1461541 /ORGANISM="Pterosperma sp., Strain CCMP1384" /LENGTH=210 /DNA_ID=CAMNT_0043475673 /DNA_START=368 /DNA_END=1000 /DNA_ORIENTATION=+